MARNKVPDVFGRLQRRHAELMAAAEAVGQAARRAGPLDERQIQLIQLAAAAAIRSEGAVHSHTRRALAAGASPEEIRHALIVLVSTIGFPGAVAATSWADDVLEAQSPPT
jgi:4-carboxymuconolactone decarboxylase